MSSRSEQDNKKKRRRISHAEIRRKDRRRQKEERKKIKQRKRSHRKRLRKRRWKDTQTALRNMFFGSQEIRQRRRAKRIMKRRIRAEKAEERGKKLRKLAEKFGFKRKRITEEDIIRRKIRQDRRRELKESIYGFIKNPIPKKRKKDLDEIVIKRKIKEDKQNRAINNTRKFFINLSIIYKKPDLRSKFGILLINSTLLYILAFSLVYFLHNFITMVVAASFDIPTIFQYYKLSFPISTYSNLWTRPALVVIFASGPLLSLIIALFLLRFFFIKNQLIRQTRMLMLWTILHGVNMFFGAYIMGMITRTGFIYTSEWIFYSSKFDVEEIIFSLIAFFVLVVTGRYVTRLFLIASFSRSLIKSDFRSYYILVQAILPFIFGSLILMGIFVPHNPPTITILYGTMFIMLIQTLTNFNASFNERILPLNLSKKPRFQWVFLLAAFVLLVVLRIGLENGFSLSV